MSEQLARVIFLSKERVEGKDRTYHLNGPCFGYAVAFLSKRLKGYHAL